MRAGVMGVMVGVRVGVRGSSVELGALGLGSE